MAIHYKSDRRLSPQVRMYLRGVNAGKPFNEIGAVKARIAFAKLQEKGNSTAGITTQSGNIAGIPIVIAKPEGAMGVLPAYFHIHGGGWVLQGWDVNARFVRDIVVESGRAAIFIDYPLSPENKFPSALDALKKVIDWFTNPNNSVRVNQLGLDVSKINLLGNSVGGNMAFGVNRLLDRKADQLILCWPFMSKARFASWNEFGEGRYLTSEAMDWFCREYVGNANVIEDMSMVYPLEAEDSVLKKTPRTLICVAENDILRDCGEEFGERLMNNRVDVTTLRFNGVIHDWGVLNGLKDLPQTVELIRVIAGRL